MPKNISRSTIHDSIHFFGLLFLAVGLVCSKAILSLSVVLLITNLVVKGSFANYWKNIWNSKILVWLILFWSLHIVALIWTSDFTYALNDIRIKLSLLLIPLIFIAQPLTSKKQEETLLTLFLLTVLITSIINVAVYYQWIGNRTYSDMRELSLFGSHIRYSLLIVLSIAISWSLSQRTSNNAFKIFLYLIISWLLYYTYFSQVLSGVLALISVVIVWAIRKSFLYSKAVGITTLSVIITFIFAFGYYLLRPDRLPNIDKSMLPTYTALGNTYSHNLDPSTFERGKPVLAYLCEEELREAWNKRSTMSYDGLDKKGQVLRFVIMRYLTSLDLRKDAAGIKTLSDHDVLEIEKGIARADAHQLGVYNRLEEIRMQIHHPINPNGFTLLQRIEYWKASLHIIKEHWLIGVGTGDVQAAFDETYVKLNSKLLKENRLRSHNTYLTTWITFGLIGMVVFGVFIFQLAKQFTSPYHFLGVSFLVIALVSFLLEDTLETQTGASFFGFFLGLFCMRISTKEVKSTDI